MDFHRICIFTFLFFLLGITVDADFTEMGDEYPSNLLRDYLLHSQNSEPDMFPFTPSTPSVQLKQLSSSFQAAYRGNVELLVQTNANSFTVRLFKQDINVAAGADEIEVAVYDEFGDFISKNTLADDGNTTTNFVLGAVQQRDFTVPLPGEGIYSVRVTASRDCYYDVSTSATHEALAATLEFLDGSKSIDLYFPAPPGRVEIDLVTIHSMGLNQTITLSDSNGNTVNSQLINELNKRFVINASVPETEQGKLWRIRIPKQDLVISSPTIRYWFRQPESYFDIDFSLGVLEPKVLNMTAAPGMTVPLRFVLNNPRSAVLPVTVAVEPENPPVAVSPQTTSVQVASASRTVVYFQATLPADFAPDQTAALHVRLQDENGGAITTARAFIKTIAPNTTDPSQHYLFFTEEQLQEIRRRGTEGEPYQQAIYRNILADADRIVADNLRVPEEESHWSGLFICDGIGDGDDDPNDGSGAPLIFDPFQRGEYVCSLDGERYRGASYDRGWLGHYHLELCARMRVMGFAYMLEPKPEYARYIRQMMLGYADRYNSFPLDDYQGNRSIRAARLMTETLGEAVCMSQLLIAYGAARADSQFSAQDRAHIEWNYLRPAAEIILGNPMGVTNWQSWHNTALGMAGFLLEDQNLVDEALHGVNGHDFVKNTAIRDDGLWQEGSIGYHFYGMTAMNYLLLAMQGHGIDAFDERIKRAYASVLDVMQPDGTFPSLNDAGAEAIRNRREHYEIANAFYDDPIFDQALTFMYNQRGYSRSNYETLFVSKPYDPQPFAAQSSVKPQMGLSILRGGSRLENLYSLMDYGPHGLQHGHFDKLHVSLYGQGNDWMPDPGTGATNVPEHGGWFRSTIGHNSMMMGERPQASDTEETRQIRFFNDDLDVMQVMQAEIGAPVYPAGSNVRRTVLNIGNFYSIVIDNVSGGQLPYDFVFHSIGDWFSELNFLPLGGAPGWGQSVNGYQFLRPPRLYNGASANAILQAATSQPVALTSRKTFGYSDDFENVDDWSGNINLSTDATQGSHSLAWVIVPRSFQSVGKSFDVLGTDVPFPDRLAFDYKIEDATFSRLLLQLHGLPQFSFNVYEVMRGENVLVNEWQRAEIDLTQPESTGTGSQQQRSIQFILTGAEHSQGAFKIYLDNMQAWRNGEPVQPETRGLQVILADGQTTQYFLTSGPSTRPPRVHPVVIARRNDATTVQRVTLLEPFLSQPTVSDARYSAIPGEQFSSLTLNRAGLLSQAASLENRGNETLYFNTALRQFILQRRNFRRTGVDEFAIIGLAEFDGRTYYYRSASPVSFYLKEEEGPDEWNAVYQKTRPGEDELRYWVQGPDSVALLDGEPYANIRYGTDEEFPDRLSIYLDNLPAGVHRVTIEPGGATAVEGWEKY